MNKEERKFLIERVAAGLRRCEVPPDYLIWNGTEEVWDEEYILNIPVLHIRYTVYHPWGDSDLPFIPAWKNESEIKNVYDFERGYEEYSY